MTTFIASDFSDIAAKLKQIEADKAQMVKGKPETEPEPERATWASYCYMTGDFDPA